LEVPAVDYQQPNKTSWQPSECLQLRVFGQPPVGDDITFSETGGGPEMARGPGGLGGLGVEVGRNGASRYGCFLE